jgi:CheY-like chemotaxis protein
MAKKVLSVGQCAADHYSLAQLLEKNFDVEVIPADTKDDTLAQIRAQPFTLILVNRVFDVNGASGLDFIRELKKDETLAKVPVMLISNHADAQHQAVARGALLGFGKAELMATKTLARLKSVL